MLNACGVDLGSKRQCRHEVLTQGVVWLALLVNNFADPPRHTVEEVNGRLHGANKALDIGRQRCCLRFVILGRRDELESRSLGVVVSDLVGYLDEEAALGSALGVDCDGGGDVGLELNVGTRIRRYGQVYGRVRECAGLRAGEEVLDEGAEAVKFVRCCVPSEKGLARRRLQVEVEHVLLVLDIHLDLILVLGVGNGEGGGDGKFAAIFVTRSY